MRKLFRRLIGDREGNFSLMFALTAIPTIVAIGCATDYSYSFTVRSQLQHAADAAAISALAEQSVGVLAALKQNIDGEITVGTTDAESFFKANLDPRLAAYLTSYDIKIQRSGAKFTSQVTYTAEVPNSFLNIIGRKSMTISGTAQGSYIPATYVDFYLMLDNSPSMGLAATTDDITKLEAKASGCAFACHIENSTTDAYAIAKNNNINIRIQLVSQAAQSMMSTAKSTRRYSDQYRMAVYSMGASARNVALTNVAAMSDDLDGVATKTATLDLMSIPNQGYNNDQQTDFQLMLSQLKTTIGTGGSGLNNGDRQKVLFFVSDGVNDSYKPSGCLKATTGGRCQAPLDYSVCKQIKDAGIRIAVLYTTYQPVPNNSWYNTWIKPFNTTGEIAANMKSCASPDLFFEVSPSGGISDAMNALFLKVVNLPKLTG